MDNEAFTEEIEILQEIYINELTVNRHESGVVNGISVQLKPSTCQNEDEQWVSLNLVINVPTLYPDEMPVITIREPRGLSEEHLVSIETSLKNLAKERIGVPMLYELIENARDSLTSSNVPYGECVVCLEEFILPDEGGASGGSGEGGGASGGYAAPFLRTSCYHYFHCSCLKRYVDHHATTLTDTKQTSAAVTNEKKEESKACCPVCRVELSHSDLETISSYTSSDSIPPSPSADLKVITLSEDVRREQEKRARLFAEQKNKGGIIDLEAERSKYLLPADGLFVLPAASNPQEESPAVLEETGAQSKEITKSVAQSSEKSSGGTRQESRRPESGRGKYPHHRRPQDFRSSDSHRHERVERGSDNTQGDTQRNSKQSVERSADTHSESKDRLNERDYRKDNGYRRPRDYYDSKGTRSSNYHRNNDNATSEYKRREDRGSDQRYSHANHYDSSGSRNSDKVMDSKSADNHVVSKDTSEKSQSEVRTDIAVIDPCVVGESKGIDSGTAEKKDVAKKGSADLKTAPQPEKNSNARKTETYRHRNNYHYRDRHDDFRRETPNNYRKETKENSLSVNKESQSNSNDVSESRTGTMGSEKKENSEKNSSADNCDKNTDKTTQDESKCGVTNGAVENKNDKVGEAKDRSNGKQSSRNYYNHNRNYYHRDNGYEGRKYQDKKYDVSRSKEFVENGGDENRKFEERSERNQSSRKQYYSKSDRFYHAGGNKHKEETHLANTEVEK